MTPDHSHTQPSSHGHAHPQTDGQTHGQPHGQTDGQTHGQPRTSSYAQTHADAHRNVDMHPSSGHHMAEQGATGHAAMSGTRNSVALSATIHCLTGCAIGEVLGMVIGTARGWEAGPTIALSVLLAFVFGYALTMLPLLRSGMPMRRAVGLALAADTVSIAIMEIVDNAIMVAIPGAMEAGLRSPLFWGSLTGALLIAGAVAFPVNRWLIDRGKGHAVVHAHHRQGM